MKSRLPIVCVVLSLLSFGHAWSQTGGRFGVRGGLGTDLSLEVVFGGAAGYVLPLNDQHLEFSGIFLGGSFSETTDNGFNVYEEKTDVIVFAAMANYLLGFDPDASSTYFIAGLGVGGVNISWEEKSSTDESLGPPLPGGGSMQSEDGTGGGIVFNLGVGHSFPGGLNLRGEFPIIVAFSPPGEATAVAPALMATAGIWF